MELCMSHPQVNKCYFFKTSGRYVLPSKKDIVKYLGNGAWAIKEEPSWMIG